MKHIETQFGKSAGADFEENIWSFEMPEKFRVRAGEFAIVPKETYDEMIDALTVIAAQLDGREVHASKSALANIARWAIEKNKPEAIDASTEKK